MNTKKKAIFKKKKNCIYYTKVVFFITLLILAGCALKTCNTVHVYGKMISGVVGLICYWKLPLPAYLSGVLFGVMISSLGWKIYYWITQPPRPKEKPEIVPLDKLPPFTLPNMKEAKFVDGVYKVNIS